MPGFLSNEDNMTFLACMLLSFFFWFVLTMSETYSTKITVAAKYVNLPKDKVAVSPLEKFITLYVTDVKGTELLRHFWLAPKEIEIDYNRDVNGLKKISTAKLLKKLPLELSVNYEKDALFPDTLYFRFENKATKLIPIRLESDITTDNHFEISDNISIDPDSLVVTGPRKALDTIRRWYTEELLIRDLDHAFEGDIDLLIPPDEAITLSESSTRFFIQVDEFTEKKISLPIVEKNKPEDISIYLYPRQVEVKFLVGLSNFDLVDESYFQVTADYSKVDFTKNSTVDLTVTQQPHFIKKLKLEPSYCEYILIE